MVKRYRPKSRAEIKRNMSAIRSRDNATEVALRKSLHALGLRFRLHDTHLAGKPDIVFRSARVAIFIDGDFWHGRLVREHGISALRKSLKTSNRRYWLEKLARNVRRDDAVTSALKREGWRVLRFWESAASNRIDVTALRIAKIVLARRKSLEIADGGAYAKPVGLRAGVT